MELESATNELYQDSAFEIEGYADDAGSENERCGICMDVIIDRGVLDCCQHWFCFTCIDNWATITNLCPLCQNEFQLITCVPVYDTIGSGKVEDDSVSRDDDWSIQGTNNTLSFPSYYIDENAVICLDGNGCKIRNGVATSGDDSVLDTSIACDSCDIWYHAFCVDFDPESTSNSWLCPRCVDDVPHKSGAQSLQMSEEYGSESDSREPSAEASHSGKVLVSVADTGETAVVVSMIEGKHWIKEPSENSLSAQDNDKQTLDENSNTNPHIHEEGKSLELSLSQNSNFTAPCDSLHLIEDRKNSVEEAVSEPNVSDSCELFSGLLSDRLHDKREPSVMESNVDLHLGLSVRSSLSADKLSYDATQNNKSEVSQLHNLSKKFSLSVGKMSFDANEDTVGSSCLMRNSINSSDTGDTEVHGVCTRDEMVLDPPNKATRDEMVLDPPNKAKGDGESLQTSQKDQSEISIMGSSQECSHLPTSSKDGGDDIYVKDATMTRVPGHTEAPNIFTIDEMPSDPPGKKAKRDGKFLQTSLEDGFRESITGGIQKSCHSPTQSKYEADNTCTKDELGTKFPGHTDIHTICTRDKMVSDSPAKKANDDGKFQQSSLRDDAKKVISGSGRESSQLTAGSKCEIDKSYGKEKMATKVLVKKAKAYAKSQQSYLKPDVKNVISDGIQECAHSFGDSKDDISADIPEQKYSTRDTTSIVRETNQRHARISHSNPADKSSRERENGTGLRVKKIMRRGAEDESSKVVENLRKEIREVVRSKAAEDLSKSNAFDPKLLLAFRNAIVRPKPEFEPVKKLNPDFVRAKKSLLQKGKIRENLTKKIYGNSNGRRKRAWDRDWEVEFWKHRCKRVTRTEKVETLMSVLDLLKDNAKSSETENDPGDEAPNPILSRLYLADASVFPRTDDIKPFLALKSAGPDEVNTENSMKKNVRFPLQISKNTSQSTKHEASSKKFPSNGSVNKQNSACTTSGSKTNDQSVKEIPGISDVKTDKRKWALEVLARKTSTVQNNATEGNEEEDAAFKGSFPLLAQLPRDMKPELAPSRHNKIPISVRQAQLYRLTEHFLRKADLPVIRRTADTELAVADAVNIEKEVVNRSNSKLVYVNLCSQALSQHMNTNRPDMNINKVGSAAETESSQPVVQTKNINPAPNVPSDLSAEAALRMAGLLDTPPSSPCQTTDENNDTSTNGDREEPDNVFDIETHAELDIYGDFEYDLENDDYIAGVVPSSSNQQKEDGDSKMKVVFSTLSIPRTDDTIYPKEDESLEIINEPKDPSCQEIPKDRKDPALDIMAESSCPSKKSLHEEIDGELSWAECEELYGPDKEPVVNKFADKASTKDIVTGYQGQAETVKCDPSKTTEVCDSESCATSRSGLPAACNSSGGGNSPNPSLAKEKKTKKPDKDVIRSISKKVEAYIKKHIRPLCKSGVITVEQYRWAVERTTTKIMKYHSKDTNANFLIKEGEKVKKLAEQYVEAAQKKEG